MLDLKNLNSLLVIIYLFQYGLLVPLSIFVNGDLVLGISTLLLLSCAISTNDTIKINIWPLYVFPLLFLIFKRPFEFELLNSDISLNYILSFLTIGFSGIFLGSLSFSLEKFFLYGYRVSILNLLLLGIIAFSPFYGENINYMKLGYGLLPSALFLFISIFRSFKFSLLNLCLFLLNSILILVFGSRGALLSLLFFIFIYIIIGIKSKKLKYALFFSFGLLGFFFVPIITSIAQVLDFYEFSTYSLEKFLKLYFDESTTLASSSSGRDDIYAMGLKRIFENPILGSPFNSCLFDTGVEYYHNLFLDFFVNLGFVISMLVILIISYCSYAILLKKDIYFFDFYWILFTLSIVRLMVSSNFWQRPEFWLFISFIVVHSRLKK